ncbi:MAG: hypothetical protein PHG03_05340 [Bacilli bacterium]|nr:hypothetical protein [Bacilli bacterium]MDD4795959.1 hypothetical protein [Bacilli bacterium]
MKRLYMLILIFIFVFVFYLFILFIPKNHTVIYKINDFEVNETYFLEEKKYQIIINYNNQKYPLIFSEKYNKSRKIVDSIKEVIHEDEKCLSVDINEIIYPICYKNNNLVDFRLLTKEIQQNYSDLIIDKSDSIIDTYQSTNIYNYNNKKYYIWNYRGYDYLNDKENTSIKLLTEDNYYNLLSFKSNRYILTPNYDKEYYFDSFFVIDNKKEELYDLKLDTEISYSSYYLGEIKNEIYLVDKKNYKEYKININKNKIKVIGTKNINGIIYTDKWEDISLKKLVNNEYVFPKKENYNYQIIDEKLYLNIEDNLTLLSNNKTKTIIYINNDEVYYLVGDVLYLFNPTLGEVKLLENNEWNFNYENKIFIFD